MVSLKTLDIAPLMATVPRNDSASCSPADMLTHWWSGKDQILHRLASLFSSFNFLAS